MTALPFFVLLIFALKWASAEVSRRNSRIDEQIARIENNINNVNKYKS